MRNGRPLIGVCADVGEAALCRMNAAAIQSVQLRINVSEKNLTSDLIFDL